MPQLIDLEPGRYQVQATFQGVTKTQEVIIESDKTSAVVLVLEPPTVEPLEIGLLVEPVVGEAPLSVRLEGIVLKGKAPFVYEWDLGDGGTSDQRLVFHVYQNPGDLVAVLRVRDAAGQVATREAAISITSPPAPPPGPMFGDISITGVSAEALADEVLTSAIYSNKTSQQLTVEVLAELARDDGFVFKTRRFNQPLAPGEIKPLLTRFIQLPPDVNNTFLTARWSGRDPATGDLLADEEEVQVFVSF